MSSSPSPMRKSIAADESARDLSILFTTWMEKYGALVLMRTCASCHHMQPAPDAAFCHKYSLTPPAKVIITGCPSYSDVEEVPF